MGSPWVNGDFVFDLNDNVLFRKDERNYINALGIQQLDTIGNIYFLDIYLSKGNCVEMHYHSNASELTYCISGEVEVSFINPNDNEWQSFLLEKGDAVSIPQGFWHVACALTDDVHLLATHDTNNLQTVFGSDLLRLTPANNFADIYCLNEQEVKQTLAPIQNTIIIGPPEDCNQRGNEEAKQENQHIEPPVDKTRRVTVYEQDPVENGEVQVTKAPAENSEVQTTLASMPPQEMTEETRESVPYGGSVVQPIHLCENCLRQY